MKKPYFSQSKKRAPFLLFSEGKKRSFLPKAKIGSKGKRLNTLQAFSNFTSAPIFGGIIFLVLIFSYSEALNYMQIISFSGISILFATLIPLWYIFYFVKKRRKTQQIDYDLSDKKFRTKPFIVSIMSYTAGVIILFLLDAPVFVKGLMFCYLVNGMIILFITLFWKISIHACGITGPLTILIYEFGLIYLPLLLIVVPVGMIRIKLKKHYPMQVIAGAFLTIFTTWAQIVFIIVPLF